MTTVLGETAGSGWSGSGGTTGDVVHPVRTVSASLWMLGIVTLLISAWGGIVPYVGPLFGFSADGAGSWHWNLAHAVLALTPGAVGCFVALTFFARVSSTKVARRRVSLSAAGLIAIASGAWFVVGPLAWPVLTSSGSYFVTAAPLRELANQVGYALGPGLILAMCGSFALGWAIRHNRPIEAGASAAVPVPVVSETRSVRPVSEPVVSAPPEVPASAPVAAAPATSAPVAAPVDSGAP